MRGLGEEEENRKEEEYVYGDVYWTISVGKDEGFRERQERDSDPEGGNERPVHVF